MSFRFNIGQEVGYKGWMEHSGQGRAYVTNRATLYNTNFYNVKYTNGTRLLAREVELVGIKNRNVHDLLS